MASSGSPVSPAKGSFGRSHLLFGLVGIVALGLGVWQIKTSLTLPLTSGEAVPPAADSSAPATPSDTDLKQRDSDQDGLSDYDEQYLYKTSAYLKDSDSDGYDDKTEVGSGNDPLCPSGKQCNEPVPGGTAPTADSGTPPALSAAEVRALLKRSGVSDAELASYNDDALLSIYRELAGSTTTTPPAAGQPASAAPTPLTAPERDALARLKGAELRKFLVKGGADAEQLKQFDDATLEAMVKEMLSK